MGVLHLAFNHFLSIKFFFWLALPPNSDVVTIWHGQWHRNHRPLRAPGWNAAMAAANAGWARQPPRDENIHGNPCNPYWKMYILCDMRAYVTSSYINNYQCIYSIYSIYIYIILSHISCVIIDLHVCIVCAPRVGSTSLSYATNNGGLS